MREQWSFVEHEPSKVGKLYLVATPIGNLEDMTFRAVNTLKSVDCIAAEDTRHSRKLLTHFEIHTPELLSYHEHNKDTMGPKLIERLLNGKQIALVTDAGTPAISDPGYELVQLAVEADIPVVPIPGPSAVISSLIISGLLPQPFVFLGFLPRDKKPAFEWLDRSKHFPCSVVFYEAPHRLKQSLQRIQERLGDRSVAVVRELTKKHEHVLRGSISEVLDHLEVSAPRGEYCIVVGPSTGIEQATIGDDQNGLATGEWWSTLSIEQHQEHFVSKGNPPKEAMRLVAKDRGLKKRDVYQALLNENE